MYANSIQRLLVLFATVFCLPAWSAMADDLSVIDPYVRLMPPDAPTTAAFMTLSNSGAQTARLIHATSPSAASVELHTHRNIAGVMQMRRVEAIEIPAGGQVALAPGGLHLMLFEPRKIKAGGSIRVKLHFADGSSKVVKMPVRTVADAQPAAHEFMHH